MDLIQEAQNQDLNLRRQFAARQFYTCGKRIHFGGSAVAISLALISPVVLLLAPDWGPVLGAIGGLWTFVSRAALERFKQDYQRKGATAQEMFDSSVLGISWNDPLARRLSEEEIHRASGAMKERNKYKSWYPTDNRMDWPRSVLICQRSNAVWARRQHHAFSIFLNVAAAGWFVITAVIALFDQAPLSQYLTTIALPSLPALLDAVEISSQHRKAATSRQLLESQVDKLLEKGTATDKQLREIQDQLFVLRRDAPLVPEWFYHIIRSNYESDMRYAAQLAASADPDAVPPTEDV
jgi:hypothetical protein